MARPSKIRRVLKWSGMAVCVLLLAVFVGSLWYVVEWYSSKRPVWFVIGNGRVAFGAAFGDGPVFLLVTGSSDPLLQAYWPDEVGWHARRNPLRGSMRERLSSLRWLPGLWRDGGRRWSEFGVLVPIWMPLLLAAVATAVLFWRDRRRIPPGHCRKCGYNLTGNVTGICSECGTATTTTFRSMPTP